MRQLGESLDVSYVVAARLIGVFSHPARREPRVCTHTPAHARTHAPARTRARSLAHSRTHTQHATRNTLGRASQMEPKLPLPVNLRVPGRQKLGRSQREQRHSSTAVQRPWRFRSVLVAGQRHRH